MAGFYYTQVDSQGRGCKVFRHQVATHHPEEDVLIYDEGESSDFSVSVENSLSKDLIQLNVRTVYKPYSNEIWLRNADFDLQVEEHSKRNKFWLMQPIQGDGIRYKVFHSGEFLYKVSNERDRSRFEVTKIRMPSEIKKPI